ncbi:MAG: glycogen synthase GlgA [Clostridia bacterium]|nr:glycogen synthase GlgA [Clostridia bacterium]
MKRILFITSEANPLIKTGGLADVTGALPKALTGDDVRVILPKYGCIKPEWVEKMRYITNFTVDLAWRKQYVGLFEMEIDGIIYYLIDNEFYFRSPHPYGEMRGDIEKFAFFCRAVLASLKVLDFQPDILHCHDWQAALVPVYLHDSFKNDLFYASMRTVLTIHNLKFQGIWSRDALEDIFGLNEKTYFREDAMEAGGAINMLKGGIVFADRVTTVSESYAEEIRTPYYGEGLDGLLRARENVLQGIVNGIDTDLFDPATDQSLAAPFSVSNMVSAKKKNKAALQKDVGLNEDKNCLLIGMVTRLTEQKGLDLVTCVLDELCGDAIQLVVLGTGEMRYEDMFRRFAAHHPGKVAAVIGYDDALSRRVYGGCDAFLMPSLFEPCGLSQLIALRYGALPIVRETGGLKDTVEAYNEFEQTGTGFRFANYNAHEMLAAIRYAERVFFDAPAAWRAMAKRAMKKDFSWRVSAKKYDMLYEQLVPRAKRQ